MIEGQDIHQKRSAPFWLVLGSGSILVIVLGIAWHFWWSSQSTEDLITAQAIWAERPFTSYRLVIERSSLRNWCRQEIDVIDEEPLTVRMNNCRQREFTVSQLFANIANRDELHTGEAIELHRHGTQRCVIYLTGRVDYHPTLGYPQYISSRFESRPNWLHPDLWRYLWGSGGQLPACSWEVAGEAEITVHPLVEATE